MSTIQEMVFGDRDGRGLPVLESLADVSLREHRMLAQELCRCYLWLVQCDGKTIVLKTRLAAVAGPVRVRVAVLPGSSPRCPTLRLTVVPAESVTPLLQTLRRVLGTAIQKSPPEQQEAAAEVLRELTELAQRDPGEFGRRLLAGYLLREKLQVLASDLTAGRRYALAERPLLDKKV